MKKKSGLWTGAVLSLALLVSTSTAMAGEEPFGAAAATEDRDYTLEEMLEYAIEDEYLAKAEYAAIMEEFDVTRPFSNIAKAEDRHIALLLPLFEKYDVPVPVNDASDRVILPSSLEEIFQIGVTAEEYNITMYEKFLEQDLPADVELAFERLQTASEHHLKAFERGGGNGEPQGKGNDGQRGNGFRG